MLESFVPANTLDRRILRCAARTLAPVLAALVLAGPLAPPAAASVTLKQKTSFDGFGERGWGATLGEDTLIVTGDKGKIETVSHPTGKFLKKFAGEGYRSAIIFRLDTKSLISVNYHDKTWYETTFEQMKQNMDAILKALAGPPPPEAQASQEQEQKKEEPPVKWSPLKLEAKRTGEKETINGFGCERLLVTGTSTGENVKTHQTCSIVVTMDQWHTQDTSSMQEVLDFYTRQSKAMGFDQDEMQAMAAAVRSMAEMGTEGLQQMMAEMRKFGGYPIRSRLLIEKGGDCGTAESGSGDPSAQQAMKDMGKAFRGLFGKKKKEGEEGASSAGAQASGATGAGGAPAMIKIFGTSSEVLSVTKEGAPAEAFEPPAGFKKIDPPVMQEQAPKK